MKSDLGPGKVCVASWFLLIFLSVLLFHACREYDYFLVKTSAAESGHDSRVAKNVAHCRKLQRRSAEKVAPLG